MFTVCPKCALTLVVTAADLKVAQGYVRCGRCSNVFNAIAALTDERQLPAGFEGYVQPDPPPPPAEEKLEFDPTTTDVSQVFVEPRTEEEETGTFESIVLETGEPDPTEPPPEGEALEQELQSLAERIEEKSPTPAEKPQPRHPGASRDPVKEVLQRDPGLHRSDETEDDPQPARVWVWRTSVVALAIMLIVQAVHHYRHDLAANPQLNRPLTAIYRALGVSLVPRWDVAAYEVHQLGATSSSQNENELIVRASIKNAAAHAQPLPLLRVAVQDRFGNRIAARDVTPTSYAPHAKRALLAAGERIDIEMQLMDPGRDAVGFEIDACLPRPGGDVACANTR